MSNELILELKRKGLHLFAIFIPLSLLILDKNIGTCVLIFTAFIAVLIDLLRMKDNIVSKIYSKYFTGMLRDHEKQVTFTGATFFFISLLISYIFFHLVLKIDIRLIASTYVAFMLGDAAAALVGKFKGKIKIYRGKTLEGFLSCFVICALIVFLIMGLDYKILLLLPLFISLSELFIIKLDDNLVVPIVSLGFMVLFL